MKSFAALFLFITLLLTGCNGNQSTPAPSAPAFTYSDTIISVGETASIIPSSRIVNAITSCTISPELPLGLVINNTTCQITGIASVTSALTNYVVTASDTIGSSNVGLKLTVADAPVISYSAATGTFGSVDDAFSVAPTTLNTQGANLSACTISPALPTGLVINNTTCVISGKPTLPINTVTYTVTANNRAGSATATVILTVYQFKGIRAGTFGDTDASSAFDVTADYTTGGNTFKDVFYGMTLQPDGKALITGATAKMNASGPTDGFIARLNLDGTLDTSFNTTGKYIYNGTWNFRDYLFDVKVFDNKIYAFGSSRSNINAIDARGIVIRLNMNGTLDTSWATSGVASIFTAAATAFVLKGEVLADGKLILLGYNVIATVRNYFVSRLNADGTLDTNFGTGGSYFYPSVTTNTERDLVIDASGNIYVSFLAGGAADYKSTIVKLNSSGAPDTAWGTNGVYILTLGTMNYPRVLFLLNNVLLVGGQYYNGTWNSFLMKLDSAGVPVPSWGTAGLLNFVTETSLNGLNVQGMAIYSNQMIISGSNGTNFNIFSLDVTTGILINSFATNGVFTGNTATPSMRVSYLAIDVINKVIWGGGAAASPSANTLIHAVKFK